MSDLLHPEGTLAEQVAPQGILDVVSGNSGLILPRVDSTGSIEVPVNGMIIYDLSAHCVKAFENGQWSDCLRN